MAINKLEKSLQEIIAEGIQVQAKRVFEERKKIMLDEFAKQLDEEQDNIIAKTTLKLSKHFSVNTLEDRVIIEVIRFDVATPKDSK